MKQVWGLSSTQVVGRIRYHYKIKKLGHIGTLDPLASGVLTVAIGEATKLIPYLPPRSKLYEFDIRWGEARDTDDAEGEVINQSNVYPSLTSIKSALPHFTGCIEQMPPLYSAIKNKGQPAYKLARKGQPPLLQKRSQIIYKFDLIQAIDEHTTRFQVECNSGTYVRALARDLAIHLGTFGYVYSLRRLHDGLFSIADTFSLEKVLEMSHKSNEHLFIKPIKAVLDDIPAVLISDLDAQRIRQGLNISDYSDQSSVDSHPIALFLDQELIAMAKKEEGSLWPCRVFNLTI
jgi:tRNA pseudouridine55 synthase